MEKIGNFYKIYFAALLLGLFFCVEASSVLADELLAEPSATEIGKNENLGIDFTVRLTSGEKEIGEVQFSAPEFNQVNFFSRGQSSQSSFTYDSVNGQRMSSVFSQMSTAILLAKKPGKHVIRDIRVSVNGKILRAPDIEIEVKDIGVLAAPNSGSVIQRSNPLPQGGLHSRAEPGGNNFFLKTEPDKVTVYKGEQVILTYALYTRTQILGPPQVERYPSVPGFLKEDIDIPILNGGVRLAPSVVNGREYQRGVLAQYAIYPLKEGKLEIDPFVGKFTVQAGGGMVNRDEDDPFQLFSNFMRSMRAVSEVKSSDRVVLEVLPLPAAGQPAQFSGLVGDYDIVASVDKTALKVGDPLNVKVKLEGRGHLGSFEKLPVLWPADFELYEDKSSTQFHKTGYSERIFEFMLIPKLKGSFNLPSIEISMFNPQTKSYQIRKSQPISIEVSEGSLGSIYQAKTPQKQEAAGVQKDIRYWMDQRPKTTPKSILFNVIALVLAVGSFGFLAFAALKRSGMLSKVGSKLEKGFQNDLKRKAGSLISESKVDPSHFAIEVEDFMTQMIEALFGISIGSVTRPELVEVLTMQKKIDPLTVKKILEILETCENYRYSNGESDKSKIQEVKKELRFVVHKLL